MKVKFWKLQQPQKDNVSIVKFGETDSSINEDIILDGNDLILPSLGFQEWEDLSLRFDRNTRNEPKELNGNFIFGATAAYYLSKPEVPQDIGDINICPNKRLGLLIGKEGCGFDDAKLLSADFFFGSSADSNLQRRTRIEIDFTFNPTFIYDKNWLGSLNLCNNSSPILELTNTNECSRTELFGTFYFGSTARYSKFEFGERVDSNIFEFGATILDPTLSSSLRDQFGFGAFAEAEIIVEKSMGTIFYFGADIEYEFTKRPTLQDDFAFGSQAEYIIANPPVQLSAKFEFGVWCDVPWYDLLDTDLIRNRIDCHGIDYPVYTLDVDLADEVLDYAYDSDLWLTSSCNITYRKHWDDVYFYFGATIEEAPEFILPEFTFIFGSQCETVDMDQYFVVHNLCPDAFVENGQNVIMDYNEVMGLCGGFNFSFGAMIETFKISETKGLPYDFVFGAECLNNAKVDRWQYTCMFGASCSAGIGREWPMWFNFQFGADLEHKFTMPTNDFEFGAFAEFELVFSFNVEFLEDGCLDNEFIPVDENGNVITKLKRKQTIEGDKFTHVIKARIYH